MTFLYMSILYSLSVIHCGLGIRVTVRVRFRVRCRAWVSLGLGLILDDKTPV